MAERKIRTPSGNMPADFDVTKYAEAASLDAKGWYINLLTRNTDYVFSIEKSASWWKQAKLAELIRRFANPIEKPPERESKKHYGMQFCDHPKTDPRLSFNSVYSVPNEFVKSFVEDKDLVSEYEAAGNMYYAALFINDEEEQRKIALEYVKKETYFLQPFDLRRIEMGRFHGEAMLTINLKATDDQIHHDLDKWLKNAREIFKEPGPKKTSKQKASKSFVDADFKRWCNLGILPYLDLMFWQRLHNVKIPKEELASVIFTDEYYDDSLKTLRERTCKEADMLMQDDTLEALRMQFDRE